MDELDAFLDERIGSDPDLLPHLLESLRKERDELEQQVSALSNNNPTRSLLAALVPSRGNTHPTSPISSCEERWLWRETTHGRRWYYK